MGLKGFKTILQNFVLVAVNFPLELRVYAGNRGLFFALVPTLQVLDRVKFASRAFKRETEGLSKPLLIARVEHREQRLALLVHNSHVVVAQLTRLLLLPQL